ncbi:MAG: hypothetical protein AD742_09380 [Methylibium sp. NZG]|nr:MAG: hypothetical protein AD742_09380 [Methylibium sp. NZG]
MAGAASSAAASQASAQRGPASAAPAAEAAATTPCRIAGLRNAVRCGVLKRALDPARPDGPKIDLHYAVVPAIARRKLPDPVFVLAGGPGQSAIDVAPMMMALLNRLGNRRDIVFVDQRGTGRSAPLQCKGPGHESLADQVDPERQAVRLQRCRAELLSSRHIGSADDLRFFTTTLAMQDLDAVRQALGAPRINLVGASYGTRAALEYQRQFPARLRRSVIDGIAPPDMVLPASFAVDGQAAFDSMLAACDAEPACKARRPTLRADWAALLQRLPQTVRVADPLTGRPETLVLTRDVLMGAVRGPLYHPALASALPVAVAAAARGEFAPLIGLASALGSQRGGAVALGMHFSVICAEDMPLLERAAAGSGAAKLANNAGVAASTQATGLGSATAASATAAAATATATATSIVAADSGDASLSLYRRVCADWPRGAVPAAFYTVPASAVPVLLLSGGLDPATPPRHGERVAQALGALARHVIVPHAGHGVMGLGCVRDVVFRFIDAVDERDALAVDAACATGIPRPPTFQPIGVGDSQPAQPGPPR